MSIFTNTNLNIHRGAHVEIMVDLDAVLEKLLIEIPPPALAGHLPREGGHLSLTGHELPPATTGTIFGRPGP